MIQNIIFGILFFKILFWAYNFFILIHTSQRTSSEFFSNFRSSKQKVSKPAKASLKDHSFYNTVLLKKSHSFNEPHLTLKITCSRATQPKTFLTLQIFQQTYFRLVSNKKTFALCHFLKPKNCIQEVNVCLFLCISVRKFLFQRHSKILFGGGWVGERPNNLFKAAGCLSLVKCFTFVYILIEIFGNSTIFQHFDYFSASIALKQ